MNITRVKQLTAEREAINPDEPGFRVENQKRRAELMRRIDDAMDEPCYPEGDPT